MEPYSEKALISAAESVATSLEGINNRLDDISSALNSISNSLAVNDTDGKGLADTMDEIQNLIDDVLDESGYGYRRLTVTMDKED